ncbi:hypothetical protein EHW64_01545 [Erwinia psidii]|uniref:hypothetical protein n=1 Tax=Erwinia psidii TaxID=69224 RepID=UPI00226B178C|nr:hypothetical protein [Erwinia psidii]MCX8959899.1 hypothetical protein [Erwinia psidii]
MEPQYINELPPELLVTMNQSAFTAQRRAVMNDDACAPVVEHEDFRRHHHVIAICRLAVEGILTRDGSIVKTATTGIEIEVASGKRLQVVQTQDEVVYPDGSKAKINSGAGQAGHFASGRSIALVGSRLSNGDEIISTPQKAGIITIHKDLPVPDDFLVEEVV